MSIIQGNAHTSAGGGGFQIERSLRFNSADSAYLSRTFSSGNRKTWTWSAWVKRSGLGTEQFLFANYNATVGGAAAIRFEPDNTLTFYNFVGSYQVNRATSQVFRDTSAWYHIVAVLDTTQATAANRAKLYINGVQVTAFSATTDPTQNYDGVINYNDQHEIGALFVSSASSLFNGYMTEINFIDGQQLTPSSFGETDSNTGVWKPKAFSGTYGTNGFYLPFKTASQWSGYFDGTGDSLTYTSTVAIGSGDFTLEAWVYLTATPSVNGWVYGARSGSNTSGYLFFDSSRRPCFQGDTTAFLTSSTAVTLNTWNHIAVVRQGSATGNLKLYLNGTQVASVGTTNNFSYTGTQYIGATSGGSPYNITGYISNLRIVPGTAVYTSAFTPPTSQLTAITNTSLLTCQSSTFVDNSTNAFTITANGDSRTQQFSPFTLDVTDDHSGQGNHWQPNNLDLRTTGAGADILVDSPTSYGTDTGVGGEVRGNYSTWNPLDKDDGITSVTNGNLNVVTNGSNGSIKSTIAFPTGKWYWEVTSDTINSGGTQAVGIIPQSQPPTNNMSDSGKLGYALDVSFSDRKFENGTATSYGTYTQANGAIYMLAFDQTSGKLWYGINGTWLASGDPAAGTNASSSSISTSTVYCAAVSDNTVSGTFTVNFGQRAFAYTAPSGFKALCTQNLPTPTIGATSTTQANDYFNAVLYTGNGSTNNITGVGFQPDFVWLKDRTTAFNNYLYDAVRGTTKALQSNSTNAEETRTGLTAFGSDGFTLGSQGGDNQSSDSFVAWNWKANGAGSSNTAGTITSTVSANTTSGFSIVTYTGNGVSGATIGHGLGAVPSFYIVKNRGSANKDWECYHISLGNTNRIRLNQTAAADTGGTMWANTTPTSTVFSVGVDADVNASTNTYVAYCFAAVPGYSAFGSYTGNGSADGPFVYTGFRPRFIMFKRSDGVSAWEVVDTARSTYNVMGNVLFPNYSNAEGTTGDYANLCDALSNGFKIRSTSSASNSGTVIYAAFAETPAKFSLAR